MNRGAGRRETFRDQLDADRFLALLADATRRFEIEVIAYCLMGNHYHLLLRTPEPRLGDAMQMVNGRYTQWSNTRRATDGALFRGRYRSLIVADDAYLMTAARYVHLNPVRGGLVPSASDYPWSSFQATIGETNRPTWLTTNLLLSLAGSAKAYAAFVTAAAPDSDADLYRRARATGIIGSGSDPGSDPDVALGDVA